MPHKLSKVDTNRKHPVTGFLSVPGTDFGGPGELCLLLFTPTWVPTHLLVLSEFAILKISTMLSRKSKQPPGGMHMENQDVRAKAQAEFPGSGLCQKPGMRVKQLQTLEELHFKCVPSTFKRTFTLLGFSYEKSLSTQYEVTGVGNPFGKTAALRTESRMCRLSWFLDPGGWSKTTVVGLYFIFPGICTLSLSPFPPSLQSPDFILQVFAVASGDIVIPL
ncbi:hypothetical protein STEG23_037073 [Scotinomys teguina]